MSRERLICICGPTGAGKTALSLAAAGRVNGAVVNFDSRQVYADFPIITAQPDEKERAVCPHRLYGFLPTADNLSAPAWARLAAREMESLAGQGLTPILVGGTGFYLKALLEPLAEIPEVPAEVREDVLARCREKGLKAMHDELAIIDPASAAHIHPNDTQRVTRALEVYAATGRTLSHWQAASAGDPGYEVLKLGVAVDLEELAPILEARIGLMLAAGALGEVRRAWKRCPDRDAPGWSGIGCSELLRHFLGEISLDEATDLWFRNTRAYAKRQMTWFKRDSDIRWFGPEKAEELAEAAAGFMDI